MRATRSDLPDWSRARSVLLVRLRSIGDTVLMTASVAALKQWRPDLRVAVLSEPLSAPILEHHPLVDELIVIGKSLAARARLVNGLRRRHFDVAFNMHGGTTGAALAALSGARHTVGYQDYGLSWMLGARAPAPDKILGKSSIHSVEQQLALLHWAGVPWPGARPRTSLAYTVEALATILKRLGVEYVTSRFACLAPAAALESKRWPAGRFARVADHLSERWKLPSVVIAGPGQEHVAEEVTRAARSAPRIVTGLGLDEVMALIGSSSLFVGNDSGPMHIAAALGRPIVAVFGSSNPCVWHPWTDSPYRVIAGDGAPSDRINRIAEADVIAAVDEVLQEAPAAAIHAADNRNG